MLSTFCVIFIFTTILTVSSSAEGRGTCQDLENARNDFFSDKQCEKKLGVDKWQEVTDERWLCYSICVYEKKGFFTKGDRLPNKSGITKALIPHFEHLSDEQKQYIQEKTQYCLDKYGTQVDQDKPNGDCPENHEKFCTCFFKGWDTYIKECKKKTAPH